MNRSNLFAAITTLLLALPASAAERIFEGQWNTTNRKLDGTMTCVVTPIGHESWQGRFYGVWQGVPFDYTVKFAGPPHQLSGTAVIDGANYNWTGEFTTDPQPVFKAKFGGNRYLGSFQLKERPPQTARRDR